MIDLREFVHLLRRNFIFIVIIAIISAVAFGFVLPRVDGAPRADLLVSVGFGEITNGVDGEISYDGYYVVEAQRRFGDLLGQELLRDDLHQTIQTRAHGTISRVARVSPLDFRVTIRGINDAQDAGAMRGAMEEVFSKSLVEAVERSGEPLRLFVTVAAPVLLSPVWTVWNSALIGMVLGIFLVIIYLLLRVGMRESTITIVEEVVSIEG